MPSGVPLFGWFNIRRLNRAIDHGNKILWIAHRYHGPVLIRGAQLDGPNRVRFGNDHVPATEMRMLSVGDNSPGGWQNRPSMTRVRAPGCYAWQVDGTTFSRIIVFKAVLY